MKLSKTQLLLAAGLTLAASTALADPLQTGFYVGGNTGASFVTNQASGTVRIFNKEHHDRVRATHIEESSVRGFNGGVFVGWNFYCDEIWFHGAELSADFFSNRGRYAHDLSYVDVEHEVGHGHEWNGNGPDVDVQVANFEEVYDLEYAINLTLRPGAKINDSTVFYGILGVSWACFDNESSRKSRRRGRGGGGDVKRVGHNEENDRDRDRSNDDSDDFWGFVLGAGLQTQVTHYLSIFGSYQYTYYGKCELDEYESRGRRGRGAPVDLTNRQVVVDTNIFKVGIVFNF